MFALAMASLLTSTVGCRDFWGIQEPTLASGGTHGGSPSGSQGGRSQGEQSSVENGGASGEAATDRTGGAPSDSGAGGVLQGGDRNGSAAAGASEGGATGGVNSETGPAGPAAQGGAWGGDSGSGGGNELTFRDSAELIAQRRLKFPVANSALPTAIDLSEGFPPVADQGSTPASVAWAAAYALKSYQEGLEEKWDLGVLHHQFSPYWILSQTAVRSSAGEVLGAYPAAVLDVIVNRGCDSLMSSTSSVANAEDLTEASLHRARRFKAASWGTLDVSVDVFKERLASGHAILVSFEALEDFRRLSAENPIFDTSDGPSAGRHTAVIVGYDDRNSVFSLMNSQGKAWGVSGYGKLHYSLLSDRKLALDAYVLIDEVNQEPDLDNLYAITDGYLVRLDRDFGDSVVLRPGSDWRHVSSAAGLTDRLYIVDGQLLHSVSPQDGSYEVLGVGEWQGQTRMTILGAKLYITQGQDLWEVNPITGTYVWFDGPFWVSPDALVSLNGWLYLVDGETLYLVDPGNGSATALGVEKWPESSQLAALEGKLYAMREGAVLQVDALTGATTPLGVSGLTPSMGFTGLQGRLYVAQPGGVVEIEPRTRALRRLNMDSGWSSSDRLVALP
ncbi:MAG TPA: hypothetical protein VFQ61_14915 [Polyangiaceae bacterium]|nr:hypothetical protein [Polyangiaceae bacterium]